MAISTIGASALDSGVSQLGKNLARNGAMTLSQRGTSEASVFGSASGYGAWPDGYRSERSSGSESGRATFSQDSSGPPGFANCLKVLETTTDASPGAADLYRVVTRVEAQNLQHLAFGDVAAKTITLSFWVFCNLTGEFTVTLNQPDASRMYSTTYTVNSANTWERKTITVPGDASGTINDDTGSGLEIGWMLGAGSNFSGGTQGSWAATNNNMLAAGMTNNVLGSSSGDWRITGVQLEVGSVATDFEDEEITTTLLKCQRYLYVPGGLGGASANEIVGQGIATSTTRAVIKVYPPVEMRGDISVTATAGDWKLNDSAAGIDVTAIAASVSGKRSIRLNVDVAAGLTQYRDCELIADGTAGRVIQFHSEL